MLYIIYYADIAQTEVATHGIVLMGAGSNPAIRGFLFR